MVSSLVRASHEGKDQRAKTLLSLHAYLLLLSLLFACLTPQRASAWNTPGMLSANGNKTLLWTWTGNGGDSLWTNGANWCGVFRNGTCQGQTGAPPANAIVVFDDSCTTNCDPTITGNLSIGSLTLASSYTGTVDLGNFNLQLSVGGIHIGGGTLVHGSGSISTTAAKSTFSMTGGAFSGGSGPVSFGPPSASDNGGPFVLSGGSFTSTSGVLTLRNSSVEITGGLINLNGGIIRFATPANSMTITTPTWLSFEDLEFWTSSSKIISLNNELKTVGDVTLHGETSGGQILNFFVEIEQGNLVHTGSSVTGSTVFKFTGSGPQWIDSSGISSPSENQIPGVELANSFTGSVNLLGDVTFTGGFVATTTLGSFNPNGAKVGFGGIYGTYNPDWIVFPELEISASHEVTIGLIQVSGNLTLSSTSILSFSTTTGLGTIRVGGNVILKGSFTGINNGAILELNGTAAQLIDTTASASGYLPNIRFVGTGPYNFSGTPTFTGNFTHVSGTFNAPPVTNFNSRSVALAIRSNGQSFNSVRITGSQTYIDLADNLTVNGDLRFSNSQTSALSNGDPSRNVFVSGNIVCDSGAWGMRGQAVLDLTGATSSVNAAATACNLPSLKFSTTNSTITGSIVIKGREFTRSTGTIDATAGTVEIHGNSLPVTVTPTSVTFGNVVMKYDNQPITIAGSTMNVQGNFTVNPTGSTAYAINGAVDVYGNVAFTNRGANGNLAITMRGSNSTLTHTAAVFPTSTFTVAKSAGQVVTLASNVTLNTNQSLNVTSGSVNLAGRTLTISGSGSLGLSAGTTVARSSGVLSIGGVIIPLGPYSGGTIVP